MSGDTGRSRGYAIGAQSNGDGPVKRRFIDELRRLPPRSRYTREDILGDGLRLHQDARVSVYYAPMDWCNETAEVVIVGLTPGWQQTEIAVRTARNALVGGTDLDTAARQAKEAARFAGPTRKNLISMLDQLHLGDALGLPNAEALFSSHAHFLHSTSVLRYPVFVHGKNYSGYSPAPHAHHYLRSMIDDLLVPELARVRRALVIPLGRAVNEIVRSVLSQQTASETYCLDGFPHPSGANGHRHRYFEQARPALLDTVRAWRTYREHTNGTGQ
ncbi:MAG: hypothetical protein ACI8PT_000082 [Gammaproteobacteria bacterium]